MNYYKNLEILNSKRKQLYNDIQNISNDKNLVQYLKNTSNNIDSLLESLFEDEGDYEENKILVQEMLEFHVSSLENLKNKLQQDLKESIKLTDILFEMLDEKKADRCKRIADRRYSKPSAYKSGAIVRCRKGKIWKGIKEELDQLDETNKNTHNIVLTFDDERRIKRVQTTPVFQKMLAPNQMNNLKVGDNKLVVNNVALNGLERMSSTGLYTIKKDIDEAKKETLRTWFKRKGAPGKTGGWVDCNTCREVDGKTKCKPCGRQKGEKRAKYPSCRPTPSACKQPGKGKKWGKTK